MNIGKPIPAFRQPDYFIPVIGAIVSAVSGSVKAGFQEIGSKINAIAEETAGKIAASDAANEALMAEMKPYRRNSAFLIIFGVVLLLIIITGIILIKRK